MVKIDFSPKFKQILHKTNDPLLKIKIKKQLEKIMRNPIIGKPMRNIRKGTRELYIKPFRLSYLYLESEDKVVILDIYHKKHQ